VVTQAWTPPVLAQPSYPPCWGNPRSFDPNSRECRSCGVQSSCKEKADQNRIAQPWAPPVIPSVQQAPWQAPWQMPVSPPQQQWTTNPWGQKPMQQWQPPAVSQPAPPPQVVYVLQNGGEFYGRYNDPVHYAIASAPLPPRQQMQGETFLQRFMKNVFLGALESVTEEALKGVRQMILPPGPQQKVIDIK
jgi:hypothetical protein